MARAVYAGFNVVSVLHSLRASRSHPTRCSRMRGSQAAPSARRWRHGAAARRNARQGRNDPEAEGACWREAGMLRTRPSAGGAEK
jgi:hypothetical protein